jgi:hypothetical protein
LCDAEFRRCSTCPHWTARTLDDVKRDTVYEAWGVGIDVPEATFEDARRELAFEVFGVAV